MLLIRQQWYNLIMFEAKLYKIKNDKADCFLCNQNCKIKKDHRGICGVRYFDGKKLYTLNYEKIIADHIDPIEKKPLYHFMPGSFAYSFGTIGCNFRCDNCQNWDISQSGKMMNEIPGLKISLKDVVARAINNKCKSIAYTYNEPTIFFEFALDVMKLAKKNGLANVWVSNGYMSKQCLKEIMPYLDAINIDLKFFSDKYYQKVCGAKLQPILDNIKTIYKSKVHLELTTLIIPGYTDQDNQLSQIINFIKSLNKSIPWHISRFSSDISWKMNNLKQTPSELLLDTYNQATKVGLKNVYIGNYPDVKYNSTYCHNCNELVIKRVGYTVSKFDKNGNCPTCKTKLNIVF